MIRVTLRFPISNQSWAAYFSAEGAQMFSEMFYSQFRLMISEYGSQTATAGN